MQWVRVLPAVALTLLSGAAFGGPASQSADTQAVQASFQTVLDGIGKRDRGMVMSHLIPGGILTFMREGKPVQLTFDAFADKVTEARPEKVEERIHDPLIRIDDNVAILWAPYELLIDGKVHHCGRDIATFARVDGRWLISSIADNSRTDCGQKY